MLFAGFGVVHQRFVFLLSILVQVQLTKSTVADLVGVGADAQYAVVIVSDEVFEGFLGQP
jgi:hypothetical protein